MEFDVKFTTLKTAFFFFPNFSNWPPCSSYLPVITPCQRDVYRFALIVHSFMPCLQDRGLMKTLGLVWSKRTRSLKLKYHDLYATVPLDSVESESVASDCLQYAMVRNKRLERYTPTRLGPKLCFFVLNNGSVALSTYAHLPSTMLLAWMSLGCDSISYAQLLLHTLRDRWFFGSPWVSLGLLSIIVSH